MFKKIALVVTALVMTQSANAVMIFQGSSSTTATVTNSVAQARAAWEAQLFSFDNDDLTGFTSNGIGGFTSTFGNIFTSTGNGSSISAVSGPALRGSRPFGVSLIEFTVEFPALVNAIGFDVFDNDGGGMVMWLTEADGSETRFDLQSVPGSGRTEFFGVVFEPTTLISSLRVGGTDPGGVTTWDNFTTGIGQEAQNIIDANAPATLLMSLCAIAFLGFRRKAQ